MKWIPYQGLKWPLPELAELLRVERATLARRVREYEAGRMTLDQVVTPGAIRAAPTKPRQISDAQLRLLLQAALGEFPPIAEALGVSRARIHQMVKRSGMTEYAKALRERSTLGFAPSTAPAV